MINIMLFTNQYRVTSDLNSIISYWNQPITIHSIHTLLLYLRKKHKCPHPIYLLNKLGNENFALMGCICDVEMFVKQYWIDLNILV